MVGCRMAHSIVVPGLTLLLALAGSAAAREPPCPDTAAVADEAAAEPADDAPSGAPPTASGSEPITIDADDDDFEFDVQGNARLCGNVEMRQGQRVIRTDCLEYDAGSESARMRGGVEYSDPKLHVRGGNGTYSPATGAQIDGAEFELPERNARGSATSLQVDAEETVTLEGVTFTTCPADDVDWELRASRIELDTRKRNGTSRGTSVRFKDVPILYVPYMSFPLGPQRKTGFLFPEPGYSSRNGAEIPVPYYWNLRPNVDLLTEPTWYSKRGLDFGGKLRYLTDSQRGELDFNYLPDDDVLGIDRTFAHLTHVAELPGEWRFLIDATDAGDHAYFEDFGLGPEGTSVPFTERLAQASYRDEHWNVRAQLQHFQTIDDELLSEQRPYARTPRILASGDWDAGLGAIEYGFDAEFVNFDRNVGVTGWRMDVAPRIGFDWSAPGFFLRPSAGYRYTQYSLEHTAPGAEDSPTRSLPFASLDAGLVFERSSGSHGQRRMTLEPRALYLYTPFREQQDLPLFDTGLPDLNLVQLYRTNRYVGADRVNDANQVAFGLTSRLFDSASGTQYVAMSLGQAYYFDKPRVVLPTETPSSRNTSDFVAQLSLTAWKNWNLDAGIQWNPEDTRSERTQFRLQYRPGGERVVNLAYRAQRQRLEQVDVSAAWPLGKHWNAFGRVVHSLRDDSTLERFAGFEYSACCWRLRAVARRFISNSQGTQETGFQLQLELIGMASVGNDANAFLERSIRGYSPETSRR